MTARRPLAILVFLLTGTAHAVDCERQLLSVTEATAFVHYDMLALRSEVLRTVYDLGSVAEATYPHLYTRKPLSTYGSKASRRNDVLRGYARFLAGRRKTYALYFDNQIAWTDPAGGVIFRLSDGTALETFGVSVTSSFDKSVIRVGKWTALELRNELKMILVGQRDEDGHFQSGPPTWAEMTFERTAAAAIFGLTMKMKVGDYDGDLVDVAKMRAQETYEAELSTHLEFKNIVNPPDSTTPPRGRLIYDMVSHGYGPEWRESLELYDIVEALAPLTKGNYALTLYWNAKSMIDLSDGVIRRYGP